MRERADVQTMDTALIAKLQGFGLQVTKPDPGVFKAALQKTDFYSTWRGKFGDTAWTALEKYAGPLA
jgi:TRAP-type transport system periplasmic protein